MKPCEKVEEGIMKSSRSNMKAVFLCGGRGKRMFPIAEDKFLLDFLGKPLLEHQITVAREAGLSHFVMIGNPDNMAKIQQIIKRIRGIKVDFAVQEKSLGIADALKSAERFLDGQILVINPNDVFSSSAYSKIMTAAQKATASSYILGYRVEKYFPGGYLEVSSRSELLHIVEKPGAGNEPSKLVNILVHCHNNSEELFRHIEGVETSRDDVYECALDDMVKAGQRVKVIPYDDFWAPIKYPWDIFKVMEHFLDNAQHCIAPSARISERATVEGKVILGDNVRVLENAVIRGPVYVGANSIIGNNVLVRDYSHIGANSVVGYCSEVKHSYIGDSCWFHSNYVGDSIIDDNCSLGAGSVLANFRLDEGNIRVRVGDSLVDTGRDKLGAMVGRGCRIGVNSSLMPGVRVGAGSSVGPQICLHKDLAAKKIALPGCRYLVKDNKTKLDEGKRRELLDKLKESRRAES
jgi:UDP-N-acetylglucosamine diphosphorylase / glucose-1-phosphate thymidylyltransferase / UDP-N-acetylgalactosamine diphosphorylase / glucosamine-1-phosphate N-acetyltransferase / galactosamine-1-phosphate N-acetyltransferase